MIGLDSNIVISSSFKTGTLPSGFRERKLGRRSILWREIDFNYLVGKAELLAGLNEPNRSTKRYLIDFQQCFLLVIDSRVLFSPRD